jgi:arabinose-5-phosphate isomerase
MNSDIKNAKLVVTRELKELSSLEKRFSDRKFTDNFQKAVDLLYKCKGKVIVTGIGKSGIIAHKIASTFNSTGTYSAYLHTGDSLHGDLGIIRKDDIVLLISKSGGTTEVTKLLPVFREFNLKIILITSNINSPLAKVSDIVIDAAISREACPHDLTPTSSVLVSLALGDSLAMALLLKRGFTREDFAVFHPGGILGKKLLLRVKDIMIKGEDLPIVRGDSDLEEVILAISSKRLGAAIVADGGKIKGIITDGDLRRLLAKTLKLDNIKAKDIMNKNPKTILSDTLANKTLEIMERNKIMQLIIIDKKKKLAGLIHMHTLVELGL